MVCLSGHAIFFYSVDYYNNETHEQTLKKHWIDKSVFMFFVVTKNSVNYWWQWKTIFGGKDSPVFVSILYLRETERSDAKTLVILTHATPVSQVYSNPISASSWRLRVPTLFLHFFYTFAILFLHFEKWVKWRCFVGTVFLKFWQHYRCPGNHSICCFNTKLDE